MLYKSNCFCCLFFFVFESYCIIHTCSKIGTVFICSHVYDSSSLVINNGHVQCYTMSTSLIYSSV